jgi:phytoene synthase
MAATSREAIDYCRGVVAAGDEDFHLSIPYAAKGDRARLTALFAFVIELRRIPDAVSEPPLGEIRLQWWREALGEIAGGDRVRAHPVVEALKATGAMTPDDRAVAEGMIEARARLLYERRFSSIDEFARFIGDAEAPVARLARGPTGDETATRAGEAYALARFSRGLEPEIAAAAAGRALQERAAVATSLRTLPPQEAGKIAFLALTPLYLARRKDDRWPIAKRATLFRAMLTGRF